MEITNEDILLDESLSMNTKNALLGEAFFGGNKYTQKMDEIFAKMQELMDKNYFTSDGIPNYAAIVANKEFLSLALLLERTVKKFFNFKDVQITFMPGLDIKSGTCTLPELFTALPSKQEIGDTGLKFVDNHQKNLLVFYGLEFLTLSRYGYTPRCCTATLLHEIGHNFYNKYMNILSMLFRMFNAFLDTEDLLSKEKFVKALKTNSKKISFHLLVGDVINYIAHKDGKSANQSNFSLAKLQFMQKVILPLLSLSELVISTIYKFIESSYVIAVQTYGIVAQFLALLAFGVKAINPLPFITAFLNNQNETFADNFASSYGYGEEIIFMRNFFAKDLLKSKLLRTGTFDSRQGKIIADWIGSYNSFFSTLGCFVLTIVNMRYHPNQFSVISNTIGKLEYDYTKTASLLKPSIRKELEASIAKCKELAEKYKKVNENKNIGILNDIYSGLYSILYKLNGIDYRSIINTKLFPFLSNT